MTIWLDPMIPLGVAGDHNFNSLRIGIVIISPRIPPFGDSKNVFYW